ncbi:Hypothetical predicted protein [Mytilus galloprovincialis]|uniref:Uncharacterized protein n=1 Tax=Mytilus galloprovincialis TaxID=29158 RepID=A0A8B6GDW9_MYTGA|nr:Hypothetical predicted protein [Mytilus galloprovincialis]
MEFHVMFNEKLPIDNWSTTKFIPQTAIGSIPFYRLATNLGEYKIHIDDDDRMALTSSNEGDNTNQAVNIVDDLGNILLECNRVKGRCFRSMLNIYNQSGFKLGYVRKRLCKCKTEYEICTANQNLLFLLNFDSNTSEFGMNITNCDGTHVIAMVALLGRLDDKLYLILTSLLTILACDIEDSLLKSDETGRTKMKKCVKLFLSTDKLLLSHPKIRTEDL